MFVAALFKKSQTKNNLQIHKQENGKTYCHIHTVGNYSGNELLSHQ